MRQDTQTAALPVMRSKQQARAAYDAISQRYDLLEGFWERKAREAGLRALGVAVGEVVLEIGPGPGQGLAALAQAAGEAGRVCGLDLSPRMLALARDRLKRAGLADRASLLCGDAAQLPLQAQFCDAVFVSFALELLDTPEISLALAECRRVLRNDGRIGVVCLSKTGGPNAMRALYEWGHKKLPSLLDCRPIWAQRSLEEAGFHTLRAERFLLWGLPVEVVVAGKGKLQPPATG